MIIDKVISSHWDGLVVTLGVKDQCGRESAIKVSPEARVALLLELLGCSQDCPQATKVTLAPVGIGTNVPVNSPGCVLQFLLPDKRELQILILPDGLKVLQEKVATLHPLHD